MRNMTMPLTVEICSSCFDSSAQTIAGQMTILDGAAHVLEKIEHIASLETTNLLLPPIAALKFKYEAAEK